jgi:hypothetical protein
MKICTLTKVEDPDHEYNDNFSSIAKVDTVFSIRLAMITELYGIFQSFLEYSRTS